MHLKIRKKYFIALEEGDLKAIPGKTYLYGYLRNYCNYIKIDEKKIESIVNSYKEIDQQKKNADIKKEELLATRKKRNIKLSRRARPINFRYVYLTGFIMILFIGLLFMNNYLRQAKNFPIPTPEVSTTESQVSTEQNLESSEDELVTQEISGESSEELGIAVEETVEKFPIVKIEAKENTWIKLISDENLIFEGILLKNEEIKFKTNSALKLLTIFPKNLEAYIDEEEIDLNQSVLKNQLHEYDFEEYSANS